MGTLLPAADFVAPAEGPVAFRRDQVPLDPETMAGLSRILGILAKGVDGRGPAERRGAAQMLALAKALDPSNASARELITDFQLGNHEPAANPEEMAKCQAEIWQYIGWLETPEAGAQGQALAACLSDIIVIADPKHPRAGQLRAAGERGAWGGWVAATAAFEAKAVAKSEEPPPVDPAATPEKANAVTLKEARVFTPLWQRSGKGEPAKWKLAPAPLRMAVTEAADDEEAPKDFVISIHSIEEGDLPLRQGKAMEVLLRKHHGALPPGRLVRIFAEDKQHAIPTESMSAPIAVLASAAVTGREPDATILGLITADGSFTLPPGFWGQLSELGRGNGGRLILPTAAAEYLPAVLALERPQFFLDYEVLLAADFRELLELAAKVPNDAMAGVSAKFREIREKAGSQPAGQYVANPFIRRRLADLSLEAPYHFSAKMLAIQGAGNRPTEIPQMVLASELLRVIAPMAWIVERSTLKEEGDGGFSLDQLGATYETCRVQVEALDRYLRLDDRELVLRVKNMLALIRTMDRAARARGEDYRVREETQNARSMLTRAYRAVVEELVPLAGDGSMRAPRPEAP